MPSTEDAKIKLNTIVEAFQSETFTQDIKYIFVSNGDKPFSRWSLGNRLITFKQGTVDARGFNQWKDVKRFVKKGSRAIYILSPRMQKIKEVNKDTNEETEKNICIGFNTLPVFRLEDTEGEPLPEYKPKDVPPLMDVAKKWNMNIRYDSTSPIATSALGYFSSKDNEIVLGVENPEVFFHELAHKAHSMIEPLAKNKDAINEAVAELSACVLASLYGYEVKGHTWQYIASYTKEKTPEAVGRLCLKVLSKVENVLTLIIEAKADNEKPLAAKVITA